MTPESFYTTVSTVSLLLAMLLFLGVQAAWVLTVEPPTHPEST